MVALGELSTIQVSAIARLFSASVIGDLASRGKSKVFSRLIRQSNLPLDCSPLYLVRDVYQSAFDVLKYRSNRHEYVYKNAIANKVFLGRHSPRTATMLTEFRAENHKADVMILNGTSTIYEIKSERDNLDRLPSQIDSYLKVSASVNVIAGAAHLSKIEKMVPKRVGILELTHRFTISPVREAMDEPSEIDPVALFHSLRITESTRIVKSLGIDVPDVPNTMIHAELLKIFRNIRGEDLHEATITVLRKERSLSSLETLFKELPKSLTVAAMATRIRAKDYLRLVDALETPISEAIAW